MSREAFVTGLGELMDLAGLAAEISDDQKLSAARGVRARGVAEQCAACDVFTPPRAEEAAPAGEPAPKPAETVASVMGGCGDDEGGGGGGRVAYAEFVLALRGPGMSGARAQMVERAYSALYDDAGGVRPRPHALACRYNAGAHPLVASGHAEPKDVAHAFLWPWEADLDGRISLPDFAERCAPHPSPTSPLRAPESAASAPSALPPQVRMDLRGRVIRRRIRRPRAAGVAAGGVSMQAFQAHEPRRCVPSERPAPEIREIREIRIRPRLRHCKWCPCDARRQPRSPVWLYVLRWCPRSPATAC